MLDKNNKQWWHQAVAMGSRLSAWIAFPVIFAIIFGKWLDKKFNSEPWLFLATVGFAFFVSMLGLIKEATKEYKKIDKEARQKINNSQDSETIKAHKAKSLQEEDDSIN